MKNIFLLGDAYETLKSLSDESVNCIVTSPPYFNLRDYGKKEQIGLEDSPELYINRLVEVFMECHRVLKNDGTLWINIADSYAGSSKGSAHYDSTGYKQSTNRGMGRQINKNIPKGYTGNNIKQKDLIGIPWMLAFALRSKGWYLRQDIIWNKPNPMPESVTDRCTKSHEYIFLLSKSKNYYFDHEQIKEESVYQPGERSDKSRGQFNGIRHKQKDIKHISESFRAIRETRNKRSVWTICTKPYKMAHFATFPIELIEPCILAGCPKEGIVLDPFMGSGTTAQAALINQRNFIGIEINEKYIDLAKKRIENVIVKMF